MRLTIERLAQSRSSFALLYTRRLSSVLQLRASVPAICAESNLSQLPRTRLLTQKEFLGRRYASNKSGKSRVLPPNPSQTLLQQQVEPPEPDQKESASKYFVDNIYRVGVYLSVFSAFAGFVLLLRTFVAENLPGFIDKDAYDNLKLFEASRTLVLNYPVCQKLFGLDMAFKPSESAKKDILDDFGTERLVMTYGIRGNDIEGQVRAEAVKPESQRNFVIDKLTVETNSTVITILGENPTGGLNGEAGN